MRIASLVPSSTEMLFALGLGGDVVGVTHECDYPPEAASLPHLTRSVIPEGLAAADIDRAVRERTEAGEAIYELDEYLLAELAPDLIVTQAVCEVCAVSYDDVRAVAERVTFGSSSASGGWSHSWVTAVTSSPTPSANSVSVAEGTSETIRMLERI